MLRAQHMLTTLVDEVRPLEKPEETPKNTSAVDQIGLSERGAFAASWLAKGILTYIHPA
ncbi:hypothetical protein ZEAMMB73_Zm00001d041282 [Zea mays]|uniref:Uncharacterized protein n=1 Tax=Zea mays TaxID=4577 RepID=A0A1D6MVE0_MAIZE|nr:hypothetical protein ZEAMMB73_Zm00001d041282 [Zea mays]